MIWTLRRSTELEDLLDGFPGSVVVVSHDRYFLERVTDHVVALLDGKLAYLPGGVDEYLGRRGQAAAGSPPQADRPVPQTARAAGSSAAQQRPARRSWPGWSARSRG